MNFITHQMNRNNIDDLWGQYNSYLQLVSLVDAIERKLNQVIPFSDTMTESDRTRLTNILQNLRDEFVNQVNADISLIRNYYINIAPVYPYRER